MPSINTAYSQHDYDQIALLARLNNVTRSEMVRRIVQAYLDKVEPRIKLSG
ncbi:metal-responsive CopG/Arc/MetJ family transcriptional regulator [Bradyrhizobium sp. USDA 326]|uniref:ribbon-helix-helix protein, CopG family n=1 Tax=unclassified Bradyrhizobium TaxID=2631580 RepID=UPI0035161B74